MMVIQMHGDPGSGKSTLARAIGQALPAIVIDKDAIKSALMRSGVDDAIVGGAAHEVARELAADLLEAGHSVVMDSPCGWPIIEEKGRELAYSFGAPWKMIELTCPVDVIDHRLASRTARLSNPTQREDWDARPGTYRPSCERLIMDGTRPVHELVTNAIAYLCPALSPQSSALSTVNWGLGTRDSGLAV